MGHRLRPDRVLPHTFDLLSGEVARQCIDEWEAFVDGHQGTRREACERMAILTDLGRQQSALLMERKTGERMARWVPKNNRAELADMLDRATADRPEWLHDRTITRIRTEVERPWTQWLAATEGKKR